MLDGAVITTPLPGSICGAQLVRIKWNVHMHTRVCTDISYGLLYPFSSQLASHERLPLQMDLSTSETDVSSVGNNFIHIERWCRGSTEKERVAQDQHSSPVRAVIHTHI